MDSTKIKICKTCAIFMLTLYLRLATATNIDCNGKSFHCVNSTHFTICVDLGGGVSVTVNDFVIECPPSTVCGVNDHLECTYQIPATTQTNIHPGDETNAFTTEMQKITKTSSDYTNPISTSDETSLTGLFNEYFNTVEVTTYANYAPDVQTYTNEVLEIPEIINNNNPIVNNHSNVLTATTDLYSFETPSATSAEMHNPIGKIMTDRSFVATTIRDIERKVNFSQGPDLNGSSSSMTLMDALHDAPIETLEKNASNVINGEANKPKDKVNQFAQINNRGTGTKPISEIIATTEMTLLTHYLRVKESQNFENSSTRIESTKNQGDQKIHDLISNEENATEKSLSATIDNSDFNSSRSESKILLSNKADLTRPITQNTTLINTLPPLELNVSETNVTFNVKNMPSTLEPTITPAEYVAETLLVTTKSGVSFNDSETLMSPTRGTSPTSHNPLTLENKVSDNLEAKSISNTITRNMTSLDFKLISEDTTTPQVVNELGKEMQKIKMEIITPSVHLNDKTSPLDDGLLETTSTIKTDNFYSDFHTSTIDHPSTVAGLNLSEQKIQDDQFKKLNSYKQHIPLESTQGEISTTFATIPNLSIDTKLKSTTDDSTSLLNTLYSTINSIEHVTVRKETTMVYSNEILPKAGQVSTKVFSSTVYPVWLNYNASETENVTKMEKNTMPACDKYNNSSNEIMTTPQLNISDQRAEIIGTQTSSNTTEYNKLLSQEANNLQMTEKSYYFDTTLSTENRESDSAIYLKEQVVGDKKAYTSIPHEHHKLEASVSENIATTNTKIQDLSINTGSSLSNYDFISTSPSSTFKQTTEKEQMTNREEMKESSKLPYHNTVPYTNLIENEGASERSPHVALQSTLSQYRNPGINKMAKNVTTSTGHYETLIFKPGVQKSMQKIIDDTQVEKTNPLKKLGTINDSIYYVSNTETITQNEKNIAYARDNHNSSYEIIKTIPDLNMNSQGVEVIETSHTTAENNKLLSQEQNTLQITEKPHSKDATLSIENSLSNSQLYLKEQVTRDNKTHTSTPYEQHKVGVSVSENISTNYVFLTTSLSSTFEQATEIEHVTNGKEALESSTTQYHYTVPYANFIENEDATEKSPQVAFLSTQSEYHISTIKNLVINETTHKYKPDVQNFMQMMNDANDEQIETTKPLYNLNAIKDSISYASNTENITEMEMNTTFTRDNHNSSFEIKIITPQLNINSQGMAATESSPTTIESYYLKKLLSQENVLQIAQNPNSNDDVENNLSKSEAYLDDQQSGYNKIYTSPQHGQHKPEVSVLDNIRTTTSKSNYDFIPTSPSSTFYLATEIEQVTGGKEATGMSTIPYYNTVPVNDLSENENKSEKLPPVALNSSKSEYRISDIKESAKNETTPTLHYENINYKPGVPNILHKITYDTQIESTNPINNSGAAIDSDVTPPSVYRVVSNINISESTTIKPLTPIAVLNSVSESMKIKNDQIYEIRSAASLSQDGQNISWQDVITPITEHSITNKNNVENPNGVNVASTVGNVGFVEITVNMKNAINNTNIFDKLQDKNPNEMVLLTGIEKLVQGNKSSHTIKDLIHNAGQINPESKIDESVHKPEFKIQSQEAFNDPLEFTSHSRNIQNMEKSLWDGYDPTRADKLITNDKVLSPPFKPLITTTESKVEDTLSIYNQNTTELVTKSYLAKHNSKYMAKNTTNKVFDENNFINLQNNNDQDIHVVATQIKSVEQKLTDKLINNETEQYFTMAIHNTTNKNILSKTNEHYFSSIMPSHNLKTYNEEANIASPSGTNLDSNKIQPVIVDVDYNDRVTQEAKFVNVTNEQSNGLSVNFPVQFYDSNDTIKRDYMINNSDIVTSIPISDRNSDISHTVVNSRIINNVHKKNDELTNEFRVFNKISMIITTKIPTDDTTFTMDKSDGNSKDRITTDKNPLDTQVLFGSHSISTSKIKSLDIDSTGDLYKERDKPNDTLKDNNSTGVASNSTEHNKLLKIPIQYLGTATKLPYRPLVLWKNIKQATLAPKLKQTEQKVDLHLNSTHGINYKVATIDQTKKNKRLTIPPRVGVNVNKRILATPNIVKIESMNNTNIEMIPNKSSTNTSVFRCAYRSRGRFADKNNCRKYYICIGLNEPILGECPKNTVFSEIKKQCTKNLSHCIRNNQFRCTQEGRFSDVLRSNIYYICVHYKNTFVRFQFQCRNGFYLNKTSVRCANDIKYQSHTQVTSLSADSLSNKGSDQSTIESGKEKKQSKEDATNICKKEGKFPDAEDCRRYYVCTKNSKSVFRRRTKKCDSDEMFHREKKKCVDIDSYEC